jgi:hypothetical protein
VLSAPLRADFATGAARAIGVASTDRRGAQNQAPVANARAPNGAAILDPASGTLGEGLGVPTSAVASFAYVAKVHRWKVYPGFPFFLRSLMGSRALNGLRWVSGCL